jgi:hypothetical protein
MCVRRVAKTDAGSPIVAVGFDRCADDTSTETLLTEAKDRTNAPQGDGEHRCVCGNGGGEPAETERSETREGIHPTSGKTAGQSPARHV